MGKGSSLGRGLSHVCGTARRAVQWARKDLGRALLLKRERCEMSADGCCQSLCTAASSSPCRVRRLTSECEGGATRPYSPHRSRDI